MRTPWRLIALILAAALFLLGLFTVLVVRGIVDLGFSVL